MPTRAPVFPRAWRLLDWEPSGSAKREWEPSDLPPLEMSGWAVRPLDLRARAAGTSRSSSVQVPWLKNLNRSRLRELPDILDRARPTDGLVEDKELQQGSSTILPRRRAAWPHSRALLQVVCTERQGIAEIPPADLHIARYLERRVLGVMTRPFLMVLRLES